MGGGSDNVTSTTNTEPPAFLQGPLKKVTAESVQGFNNTAGGPGAGLIPGAQNLIGQTIQGDFLSPDSNPFLQQTFNRAADLTRGRLDSEFSGAGRNLGASQPARSQELQDLAGNIFGGNFQQERDRQVTATGQAPGFDPLNMLVDRLSAIIPGAGGTTTSQQPVFRQGLFG